MRPHSYSGEGIIIGRRNLGEADKIYSIFTKDNGKISLLGKGTRRPKSRKRGHLEIFNKIDFQAVSGHSLDIMTEAVVLEDFKEIRQTLKKISLAYYFSEVIARITHEGEPHSDLYFLIQQTLEKLKNTSKLKVLRLEFITKLLILMGYWPEGKALINPDLELEKIIERQISSERVGKIMVK